MEHLSIEEISVSHLHRSNVLPVEEADSTVASSVDQNPKHIFKASDFFVDLGKPLDADVFNEAAENEASMVNIGKPLDADSPSTDYTYETPVDLDEPMDADSPGYSISDDSSEYQNIGPDMFVGEEFDWRFDEPSNIGLDMDADNY